MPIYTIIGGVNGSGRSSLTGVLKTLCTDLGVILDVDKLAAAHGGFLETRRIALRTMDRLMQERASFTQETTLSGQRPARMARRARDAGYFVRLYYVGISGPEEALRRIANRVAKGGHDIPEEDVRRRYAERFTALQAVLPYVNEAVFFDNENGFVEVAEYRNGELLPKGNYRPAWLEELLRALHF